MRELIARKLQYALLLGLAVISLGCSTLGSQQQLPEPAYVRLAATDERPEVLIFANSNSRSNNEARIKLLVKAGALQEDDNQLGYAHFVEHMAFRGSNNFPEQAMQQRMRELGIELGRHSNAYTTFDHTAYWLDLNDVSDQRLSSALELLSEWAFAIEFSERAVAEERAVIVEEWRLYQQDAERVSEQIRQNLFAQSRHLSRLPILGTRESIESTDAQGLREFYQQWYHPQNMAVIVTGDVDADQVLQWIDQYFVAPPISAEARTPEVHDIVPAAIAAEQIITDGYTSSGLAQLLWFVEQPRGSNRWRETIALQAGLDILAQRLERQVLASEGQLAVAFTSADSMQPRWQMVSVGVGMYEDHFDLALSRVENERQRLVQLGVTEQEWANWQNQQLSALRSGQDTAFGLAEEALDLLLYGDPLLTKEQALALFEQQLQGLKPRDVKKAVAQATASEPKLLILYPNNKPKPEASDLRASLAKGRQQPLQPLAEQAGPIWPVVPTSLGVAAQEELENGLVLWTLNNGMQVYYRYADNQPGQAFYRLVAAGGFNQLSPEQVISARLASTMLMSNDYAGSSGVDMADWRAGQGIELDFGMDFYDRTFLGSAPVDQLDLAFLDLHSLLTELQYQPEIVDSIRQQNLAYLQQMAGHPHQAWSETIAQVLYGQDVFARSLTTDEVAAFSLEDAQTFYQKQVAGGQNYVMALVGDLSQEQALALVDQYLASLPATEAQTQAPGRQLPVPLESGRHHVPGSGEEYAQIILSYYLPKSALSQDVNKLPKYELLQWLDHALFDEIRTAQGLVYYISSALDGELSNNDELSLDIYLGTDPDRVEEAIASVEQQLQWALQNPATAEQLAVWHQSRVNEHRQNLNNPSMLASRMAYSHLFDLSPVDRLAPRPPVVQAQALQDLLLLFQSDAAKRLELVWLP